ncbi:expressed unknown protein [Seminavis robusta]|uniref:Uncharacterized protein n=1 Tax=Seminavis robusta TaxID=568900 RepID=A0A9N8E8W6_9STRA|nr:expressed unknown protein [Seminavis robusta]|eukprot:Sro814_g206270.1 n/a (178) ;mRNA; r:5672-6205
MTTFWNHYWPVAKEEGAEARDWRDYPANRPCPLDGVSAPSHTVFVKTGGNALQAVDRSALQQKGVVAVTVPWNARPGQEMLVRHGDRWVTTQVPDHMLPGHVFLMRVPETPYINSKLEGDSSGIMPSKEVNMAQAYVPPSSTQQQQTPHDLLFEEATELTHVSTGIEQDQPSKRSIV